MISFRLTKRLFSPSVIRKSPPLRRAMSTSQAPKTVQPAVYVPHGGGPIPILGHFSHDTMIEWINNFQRNYVTTKPDAIVVVTAHWEAPVVQITSAAAPELYYDYYGFPEEAYKIKYPAPGHPALAKRIQDLLTSNGIASELDDKRGNDHGVFVPLKLMFPAADIPIVQMSLLSSLDPAAHIKIGEALRSLRSDNILIVGSGMSFHGSSSFRGDREAAKRASIQFHEYLTDSLVRTTDPEQRRRRLERWEDAPFGRMCHRREEHLIPLHVIAGAGLDEPCEEIFDGEIMDLRTAGFLFGKRT